MTQQRSAFAQPLLKWKSSKYYIFWVCVCTLNYRAYNAHAPHCHLWCDLYFSTLSHKRYNFQKKKITEHKMCFFIFSKNFVWNIFILMRIESYMIKNVRWSSRKVPVIIVRFNKKYWIFSTCISKNAEIWNFVKIRSVGAKLFHADRRTDMTKLTVNN